MQLLENQSKTFSQDELQLSKSISMATILDGTFFKLMSSDFKNGIACWVKCQPKNVNMKGFKYSSSNFKSHLKRMHGRSVLDECKNYIIDAPNSKKQKIKVSNNKNCKNKIKYSQKQFDENATNYIIHAMASHSIVKNPFFKEIIIKSGILKNNNLTLMSRRSLGRKIQASFNSHFKKTKSTLEKVNYLCITANVWSAKKRSFMGITFHWIDEDSLEGKTTSLACRHFRGDHTHDRTANILRDIYYTFKYVTKVNGILLIIIT